MAGSEKEAAWMRLEAAVRVADDGEVQWQDLLIGGGQYSDHMNRLEEKIRDLETHIRELRAWRNGRLAFEIARMKGFYDGPFPDLPCNFGSLGFGEWFLHDGGHWMRTHDMDDGHTVWNAVGPHGGFLHLRKNTTVQPVPNPLKGGM